MIPKGMFSQVLMILMAVAIILTYVKPLFVEISEVQDEIAIYKEERKMVISVNSQLASLVSSLKTNVSNADQRRLQTYLPNDVDGMQVSRDVFQIVDQAGVIYKDIKFAEPVKSRSTREVAVKSDTLPTEHMFTLSVEGRYQEVKNLFALLSQNEYSIEVQKATIVKGDKGVLKVDIEFSAYSYREYTINNKHS